MAFSPPVQTEKKKKLIKRNKGMKKKYIYIYVKI